MRNPVPAYASPGIRSATGTDAVLASLPLSYRPATDAVGSVCGVDGWNDWPAATVDALDAGAAAVVVVEPQPADVAALRARQALVVLDSRWASNPVVTSAALSYATALPAGGRLECQVLLPVGTPAERALLDQLTLVRSLVGPVTELRMLTSSDAGYAAEGVAAGHPVDLSLVCSDAVPAAVWVRLLTADGSVDLMIPDGATAEPARLSVTDPAGVLLEPTLYESGHRAAWRRARTLLDVSSSTTDLDDFQSDRETARTAFQLTEG